MSPIGWWGAGALGLGLIGTLVTWQLQVSQMRLRHVNELNAERAVTQQWKDSYEQLEDAVGKQREDQLAQQLRESEERDERERGLRAEADRLRRLGAAESVRARELADELLRRLAAAPKVPESRLDAAARDYYRELREQQCRAAAGAAAAGDSASGRVSGCAE